MKNNDNSQLIRCLESTIRDQAREISFYLIKISELQKRIASNPNQGKV